VLEQRLDHVDRALRIAGVDQRARLRDLIAILVEQQIAGEIADAPLDARPERHQPARSGGCADDSTSLSAQIASRSWVSAARAAATFVMCSLVPARSTSTSP